LGREAVNLERLPKTKESEEYYEYVKDFYIYEFNSRFDKIKTYFDERGFVPSYNSRASLWGLNVIKNYDAEIDVDSLLSQYREMITQSNRNEEILVVTLYLSSYIRL